VGYSGGRQTKNFAGAGRLSARAATKNFGRRLMRPSGNEKREQIRNLEIRNSKQIQMTKKHKMPNKWRIIHRRSATGRISHNFQG
jgi:hypothetical protein